MEYDKVDFISAIENLASLAGLEVPTEAADPESDSVKRSHDHRTSGSSVRKACPIRIRACGQYLKGRGLTGLIARDLVRIRARWVRFVRSTRH